jgi:molecular chaperone HscB
MDLFQLYQISPTFKPEAGLVKKRYLQLSREFHPDFFTNESPEKQGEILQLSSQVNEGYKVLLDQDRVIRYILKERGLLEDEEKYKLDPIFLGEMMDINEQLMDAEMDGDASTIAAVEQDTLALQTKIYHDVAEILESDQAPVDSREAMLQVKSYYYRKKYLQRILDKLASMRNIAAP